MSYNTFPSIKRPDYGGYTETFYKPFRSTELEANTVSLRPKGALGRREFTFSWSRLPQADYNLLKAFFLGNAGSPFYFTPYGESASLLVSFLNDTLKFTASAVDTSAAGALRWKGEIILVETIETEML